MVRPGRHDDHTIRSGDRLAAPDPKAQALTIAVGRLDDVEERPQDVDIMAELMKVREQLRERGIVIDAEAWRREEEQQ